MTSYIAGSLVTVSAGFISDSTGLPADPTSVTLSVSVNGATPFVYTYNSDITIVRSSTGDYYAELDTTNRPGTWIYQWDGTGSVQAINVAGFVVVESPIPGGSAPIGPGVPSDIDGGNAGASGSTIIDGGPA